MHINSLQRSTKVILLLIYKI
uniref:Uncharacterized protein n=1 Tax=Rhizophora mucronata TaxID=61149 RepID=A0A2P2QS62_RHIMU